MSDKLIEYIDKPFYEVKCTLDNGYVNVIFITQIMENLVSKM